MGLLYFTRHGQTIWNVENKICGATDIALTDYGHEQAIALGNVLKEQIEKEELHIDEILYSPLVRAADTAKHISEVTGIPAREEKRLKEQNFGRYEGTPRDGEEFRQMKANFVNHFGTGETMLALAQRIYNLLDELKESDKTYLLVAHNGIARVIQSYFFDMTNEEYANFGIKNCEVRRYSFTNVERLVELLNETYGTDYRCYLNHENAFQLLIATMLSAQCTDARVNIVTKDLFQKYPTVESFANADVKELERDIYSTGFYKNKAKNIIACSKKLLEKYNGEVPSDLDELIRLDGVGRKTANVIRGNIFHEPSIVVDTHVKRISKLLGLTKSEDPVVIEKELMEILPKEQWILYNIQIIQHGRQICIARRPKCKECTLREVCPSCRI